MAIILRQAQSIVWGTHDFGTVNEVLVEVKSIPAGRDSLGRSHNAGYDVKLSFNQMDNDFMHIYGLINLSNTPALLRIEWHASEAFELINVIPLVETISYDADGKPSKVKIAFDKIMTKEEALALLKEVE